MLLKNLIDNLDPKFSTLKIKGISFDTRSIKKDDLFISIKGNRFDGDNYINQAIAKGAKAVIYSKGNKKNKNKVFIKVNDPRKTLAKLSSKFYKDKPKNIVAVTGTNGKTSVADFFHQIFSIQKIKVGFIGTLGFKKNNFIKERSLTTLDPISLHKDLSNMKKSKIDNVIIEASSHGLKQKRLDFLNTKVGIFTNLSHDHLDYHKNMSDYLSSKLILFKKILRKKGNIVTDTDIKQYKNIKKIQKKRKLKIYTIGTKSNIFNILNHKIYKNHQILKIKCYKKIYTLKINLFGSIQIKNLLMSVLAAKVCGLKIDNIFKKINKIKSVNGRLELVKVFPNKSKVFLDYAHTPDALKSAITSLQEHHCKKITLVFGCGGERDIYKRKQMGEIAKKFCKKVYITDDNPRSENPKKIRNDIIKGLKNYNFIEIANRKKAVEHAIRNSKPYEIILIAGKGHENYQQLKKNKIFLSDRGIILNFRMRKNTNNYNNISQLNADTLKEVLKIKKNYPFNGVSINSKNIKSKNLFVAIKGKRKDGHSYLKKSIKRGASFCIVSKKFKKNSKFIKVKNTMNFLKSFANANRNLSSAKFIAVTGSSGKTTVKDMLGRLLNNYSRTFFSPSSFNNRFGVPLSLSNIGPLHEFGVFEVGMNKFGEINNLSSIIKPHVGVITNISEAHLENFNNLKDIAKAKSEIIKNIEKGGAIVLNKDDSFYEFFKTVAKKNKIKIITFGYSKSADVRFLNIRKNSSFYSLNAKVNQETFSIKMNNYNKSNIMNILCCLAILSEFNLPIKKINNFFTNYYPPNGRGQINKVKKYNKKFYLVDESYNANPLSVKSAIENFSQIKKNGKKKYFLFADMLELGKNSDMYHKKISRFINMSDIDKTFVFGDKAIKTFKYLKSNNKGNILKDLEEFKNIFPKILNNGDYLMIKGSNAMKLHQVSKKILKGKINAV